MRKIDPSEYMSTDSWKYPGPVVHPYKRGSLHNKVGMWIMWIFYAIIIVQLIHALIVVPFFPIWAIIFAILGLMTIVVIKGK
tara:strand:- start:1097 stop:1342 length:246 start_codon:yes stop_codon:yes gene_type:complete